MIPVEQYFRLQLRPYHDIFISRIGRVFHGIFEDEIDVIVEAAQRAGDFGLAAHEYPDGRSDGLVDEFEWEDAIGHFA